MIKPLKLRRSVKPEGLARLLLVLLCLPIVASCLRRSHPIHYVVPEGYRGPFWIIHDPGAPALPAVGDNWIKVTVPANGIVRGSSLSPLDAWHESTAVLGASATGADLEVGKTIVSPGMVGVWLGPRGRTEPEGREYRSFFVGTEAEFVAFDRKRFQPPQLR